MSRHGRSSTALLTGYEGSAELWPQQRSSQGRSPENGSIQRSSAAVTALTAGNHLRLKDFSQGLANARARVTRLVAVTTRHYRDAAISSPYDDE
jgi:hypothetical protein